MASADPVHDFAHDHVDLNRRVLGLAKRIEEIRAAVHRTRSLALIDMLHELRDPLFLHIAREEEGLFPFVAEFGAELTPQVDAMAAAHDTICGALARMCQLAAADAPIASLVPLFERFERAYAEHAESEAALLATLKTRLADDQRRRLAMIVAAL